MATYLLLFDTRNPETSTAAGASFAQLGATELWPGAWVIESGLTGVALREQVGALSDQQGYLLTPFTAAKTSAAGLHGQAPKNVRTAFADLIAKPILNHDALPFDPLINFKSDSPPSGVLGVGTLD